MPGPTPNRSEDLARPRARKGGDQTEVTKGEMRSVAIPTPDLTWHSIALMVWNSLEASGQSDFYQQTDWAYAYSLCDDISAYKKGGRWNKRTGEWEPYRSPEMLKALQSAMSALLMTESDRRKARIELVAPEPEQKSAAVIAIADYQAALDAGPEDDGADDAS